MTDLRQQIAEALDEAELVAASCRADVGPDPEHYPSNIFGFDHAELEFMRAWDPATVLRLVERDRRDLADACQVLDGDRAVHVQAVWLAGRALERMAAFWLGSPEGS